MAYEIDKLSVFLPTYNEEGAIRNVVLKTRDQLVNVAKLWEIVVVNDGSVDKTPQIVSDITKQDNRIKLITHPVNLGYGATLQTGLYKTKYPWVAFIDSDGQFDFSEITSFIAIQKKTKADLVIGYYKRRQVSFGKVVTSKIWESLVFLLFGLKVRDIDCGFKLISRKVIETIPRLKSQRGAFVSSELLIKAKKKGFKIVELPVTHYPRLKGVGTGRNLNVIVKSFGDLFTLWKELN